MKYPGPKRCTFCAYVRVPSNPDASSGHPGSLGHLHYLHFWWKLIKASMNSSVEASVQVVEAPTEAFMSVHAKNK